MPHLPAARGVKPSSSVLWLCGSGACYQGAMQDIFASFRSTNSSRPQPVESRPQANGTRQCVAQQLHQTHDRFFVSCERLRERLRLADPDPTYADEREAVLQDLASLFAEREASTSSASGYPGDAEGSGRSAGASQDCSGCRLRKVLTDRGTSTSQLRSSIEGVEALVNEARRELSSMQTRERRSAYEKLMTSMEKGDEEALELALKVARDAELDLDDIIKAENKLLDLKMMSPEEKTKKIARKLEGTQKMEAFLFVKNDNVDALTLLLESLADDVRWQDWRDYAGRSLWKCAQDLRAPRVQQYLAPKLGITIYELGGPRRSNAVSHKSSALKRQTSGSSQGSKGDGLPVPNGDHTEASSSTAVAGAQQLFLGTPATPARKTTFEIDPLVIEIASGSPSKDSGQFSSISDTYIFPHSPETPTSVSRNASTADSHPMQAQAMRAVAQDDIEKLLEILRQVPSEEWVNWQNKAGKDLLTLSQERGSTLAYGTLMRELGQLKELHREAFEEREAVWVFEVGQVQPRRATVIEDAPEDDDDILVEFWDGDEPAVRMERCLVRKSCV